jgi:hypothetical protein
MSEPTDLMVSAFYITPGAGNMYRKSVAIGISAALAVAPTVDGWVWCEAHGSIEADPCFRMGNWKPDVRPCPSCTGGKPPLGVPCYTCAGAECVDRGEWGTCPGPHAKLIKVFKSGKDTP